MAYWLAQKRNGQDSDYIQRFDPRFWTVDFPRPMMASVVTTAPDAMRIDLEFHHKDALAGLIWESEDTLDHPLLAYEIDRDYQHTIMRFRWRSSGVVPLDQIHGPTLTIEGRDGGGAPRSWFVRLWNYATGSPEDAVIEFNFSALSGGWDIAGGGDPVHPLDIDRMFISLVPPGYDPASADPLPARVNGWVEVSGIASDGERGMLEIGDVLVPPHGVGMCTAYDDSYNQTPARLLRVMRGLGYRDSFVHYVGMSHYYRLGPGGGSLTAMADGTLAKPCEAWHANFFALAVEQEMAPIISLSFELLDQDCPQTWKQRDHTGATALTGWSPPSTLLSPANLTARDFLRLVTWRFMTIAMTAGAAPAYQIGEPWWWINPGGRICLYDDAARAEFGGNPPVIEDIRGALSGAQIALLDAAGYRLWETVGAIRGTAREVGGPQTQVMALVFTPTLLDPDAPELYRANLPPGWAYPYFDRLQLEDYDWLTSGAEGNRRAGYSFIQSRFGYPPDKQDYLAGFVLDPADAQKMWPLIDGGLDEAKARGVARQFVWALPQVSRDGYTRIAPTQEEPVQAFDDIIYPLRLGRDTAVSPEFSTSIAVTSSGHERRNSLWSDARLHFDVGPGVRSEAELGVLIAFYRARRGAARGFRIADPFDFSSHNMAGVPRPTDQRIGTGDGSAVTFRLAKNYGDGDEPQVRMITRPKADTILVAVDGTETNGWTLQDGGSLLFDQAPPEGAAVTAGFLFDVPVRFAEDRLDVSGVNFAAGEVPSVPLVEIREAV